MIAISLDTEWVPDEVLDYALDIILSYRVKLTIFATHKTSLLRGLDRSQVEIGVHPNFRPLALDDKEACQRTIANLLDMYPEAQGVRCHSLVSSIPLSDLFASMGFKYECNMFLPYQPGLTPYRLWNGLVRIPIYWQDDLHCMYGKGFDLEPDLVNGPGVKVFSAHPPQIFMNVEKQSRYLEAKLFYHQPEKLRGLRYSGQGVRTFTKDLCAYISNNNVPSFTLSEIASTTPLETYTVQTKERV
ncbi:hypothetical protein ACFLX9_01550 [Chloroflexota bacterium]